MLVRTTCAEHFSATSAHGVPKLLSAKSATVRVLWIVLLLASLIGFTYNLQKITLQYLSHPLNYQAHLRHAPFDSPDIYICNPMTFSGSLWDQAATIYRPSLHLFKKYESLWFHRIMNGTGVSFSMFATSFSFSSINLEALRSLVHSKEQTIIQAILDGNDIGLNSFEVVPHDDYFNCFKFLNSSLLKSPKNELTLYLFTDSTPFGYTSSIVNGLTYKGDYEYDMPSGLVLLFSKKRSYPRDSAKTAYVSAGMKTDISISMSHQIMINRKSQPCTNRPSTITYANRMLSDMTYARRTVTYTLDYQECVKNKWSLSFYRHCDCVPLNFPRPVEIAAGATSCSYKEFRNLAKKTRGFPAYECIQRLRDNNTIRQEIHDSCKSMDPCHSVIYKVESFNTRWPATRLVPKVIKNLISPMFKIRQSQNFSVPGWKTMINVTNDSDLVQTFRSNVLKVVIRPAEENITVWEETPAYPVFNFISDIGGILGLYMGMSLLTLLELIELVVKLCKGLRAQSPQ